MILVFLVIFRNLLFLVNLVNSGDSSKLGYSDKSRESGYFDDHCDSDGSRILVMLLNLLILVLLASLVILAILLVLVILANLAILVNLETPVNLMIFVIQ